MPNLRGKTWTTTTPANVADANFWEDHLISDEDAAKAAGAVQSVNNTLPDENGNINIQPSQGGPTVIDSLNSTSATDALSANQGHVLKGLVDGKQDALTFDNTPTDNSANPVKSNGIYGAISDVYGVMGENGAKNKCECTATDSSIAGVSYTINDGIITGTWSSTPTGSAWKEFSRKLNCEDGKKYILSGCPSGGAWTGNPKYRLYIYDVSTSTDIVSDTGEGAEFIYDASKEYRVFVVIGTNAGASGSLTFKPMIRLASDTNPDYQPPAMTNAELTEKVFEKSTLSSADDLNDITETGIYGVTTAPTHSPESLGYCILIVKTYSTNPTLVIQTLIKHDVIYSRRLYTPSSTPEWSSWYKFTGTVVS